MPFLWAAWIYVPWRRGLSSLGEAASLKSSLLFSSESLIRALFLKWSPWPQSSFRCLISPTLHIPCCALKVYHLLRVSRISGIIRRHCYQLFCCFGRRSLHIQPDWFHSLLFSWVSWCMHMVAGETGCLLSALHCFAVWFATHCALKSKLLHSSCKTTVNER